MKIIIVLTIFILFFYLTASKTLWHQLDQYSFEDYVKEYQRDYTGTEYISRKQIFMTRLAQIKEHNRDSSKTWKQGVNQFTDRTDEEFKKLLGYKKSISTTLPFTGEEYQPEKLLSRDELPARIDWRDYGIVSPVKDQGQCGSCWTFATAETLESAWALSTGQLPILSEQQILDCTPNPQQCGGTGGCGGGTAELAMQRLIAMGGLASEWTYSYQSYFGKAQTCQFSSRTPPAAKLKSYVKLPSNKYSPLLQAVATIGPIAISVDASAWSSYESGVFNGCNQTNPDIDHAVQLVGYGSDQRYGDYWLVRNSWAPTYGEEGYIRVKREENPPCGIDIHPSDGTGCKDGPPTVVVCGTCGILYDSSYPIIAN